MGNNSQKAKALSQTIISDHATCITVDFQLDKFWQLEEISEVSPFTKEELACEDHYK